MFTQMVIFPQAYLFAILLLILFLNSLGLTLLIKDLNYHFRVIKFVIILSPINKFLLILVFILI